MIKSENIVKLMEALTKAQDDFPIVKKDSVNPHFKNKYAALDSVIETLTPTLRKHGLTITQPAAGDANATGCTTFLFHNSGEYLAETLLLPSNGPGKAPDAQGATAAVTYSRRTGFLSILGIVSEEDDDGNKAVGRTVEPIRQTQPAKPVQPPKAEIPTSLAGAAREPEFALVIDNGKNSLPSSEQYDAYVSRLAALRSKLERDGGLKASRGLPAPRKMLNYIKQVTQTEDLKQISTVQFDAFLAYAEKMDPVALTKLINETKTGGK